MRSRWALLFLVAACVTAAERRVIFPPGAKPIGPYSPGILAGDFLYVSGQGARGPNGQTPATFEEQVAQSLENVKAIVEAAGLTMEHVVYSHVYLDNMANYDAMNRVYARYFQRTPPARATVGVFHMPIDTPVEINAVAIRDLARKKAIVPKGFKGGSPLTPGILAGDRLYVSGQQGRDPDSGKIPESPADQVQLARDRFRRVLAAAGMDFRNVAFVNPYLTARVPMGIMNGIYAKQFEFGNTPGRATIQVASLPHDANIEYTGVAVRDLSQRRAIRPKNMPPSPTASPCVFAGNTLYCSAKSGFIPGAHGGVYASTTSHQLRQTMRNLLDNLEEAEMNFDQVVSTNVYLDDLSDTPKFDDVYIQYFNHILPARTTIEQIVPVERKPDKDDHFPDLEQVSLIAIR